MTEEKSSNVIAEPTKDEEKESTTTPSVLSPRSPWAIIVDVVGILVVGGLIYAGKLTPTEGIPWLVLILGARIPSKGSAGGIVTMIAPVIGLLGATKT